ncbi:hypothetical protein CkaCkLH20_12886 [Colletotrichum karsti]|uniref:Xylanolytic transcriptional activator regulatory domain-containing protein n=1 Tax=Colletotrichum karsti TaxID=1095194 RepID=A0A9P6LCU4_9PEZI|nr:uncharacterized protein CkaCkLH20_12886 [Colletotrichum karsti]KAF9869699.1 hypothetical protein CkaCkLH20_12886 [Colletotrichum karsti]
MPFLHTPTLKNRIYDLTARQKPVAFDAQLVLLGLLALTARYHPELLNDVKSTPEDLSIDSNICSGDVPEVFARALDKSLGSFVSATSIGSVERVQALLILGLYEWISLNHEGLRAWMLVGAAGRMAQALKLGHETKNSSSGSSAHRIGAASEEFIINHEIRRRTMYSCFIFDRLISCGKERPSLIRSEDLQIHLPCSKENFDLSRQVTTAFFTDDTLSAPHRKISILGHFVHLVNLWGRISHYTNAGGRFLDKRRPPWDRESMFFRLRQDIDSFSSDLEVSGVFLNFSPSNYFRHEGTSNTYILLHLLMALCKIMLHRQYLPFIPIKCSRPDGPLDEPTFPSEDVPDGFWIESARELFKSSKTVSDIIELSQDKLPHSPLVAFVIYTASFTGIYAWYFPQMDTEGYLASRHGEQEHSTEARSIDAVSGPTRLMFDALSELAKYSGVASAFVSRYNEVDQYFHSMVQDYHRNLRNRMISQLTGEKLGVRMGGDTGGLEEWVLKSDRMVSNSSIIKEDDNPEHIPPVGSGNENTDSRMQSSHRDSRCEDLNTRIRTPPREAWTSFGPNDPIGSAGTRNELPPRNERFVETGGHMQSPPLSSAPSHVTGADPGLWDGGDEWSWAFLHDMYLGSVAIDSGNGFPDPSS